ncbi:MAG: HAMP domain-containing protein [Deltaproteobacteria bacterium]|nr:HAMP domain-containing protein [Deltaproteobacteria bacterium]
MASAFASTLRGRLILLVSFATVPAILFIFLAAERERSAAMTRMETEARHLGSLASREHAHELNGGRSLLRRLGKTLACEPRPTAPLVCPDYLEALLSGFPQFANIGVASPTGDVLCSAAPLTRVATLRENTAFERAFESTVVETGTYTLGFVGRPVLHQAYAVRDPAGEVCSVAFVAVELGWLDQLAQQANLPADYSLLIADREGHLLAHSGGGSGDFVAEQGRINPALADTLHRPHGAVLDIGVPSSPRYFVATPMTDMTGVFVIAGLPYGRVRATADLAFYRTLIGLVLVTVFAIVAAMLAAEFSVLRVLRALTRAVRRFGAGDLSARAPIPGSHGELRELAVSFGNMADSLAVRQQEARDAQDRLRALSHRLQTVRDEEAGRIARELHDELGQMLTGLKMDLARVRRLCTAEGVEGGSLRALEDMNTHVDGAIDSVRRISSELHPPVLDRLGLGAALDWLARDREEKAGLAIPLHIEGLKEPVETLVATTVFRVMQEALTNVIRHAGASVVTVDLVERDDALTLTIHDDGRGIDAAAAEGPRSLGILGMHERARLIGGSLTVRGAPGAGTTITLTIPRRPTEPREPTTAKESTP